MYTQRKTHSYDLVGTNARNSNCSYQSGVLAHYGEQTIARMSLEKSDVGRSSGRMQNMDSIFC